ncbi:MAG: PepSY domain-containing protein [Candidatus Accumulibacter sp.]|jgi:uncharacterized iron-regulated membrane protein|nr:PepSY domain-containing protein [Accumulibacter sp.]
MRSRTLHFWKWIHRWSSLVCTLFMLLLCLTGLPLIFSHEIDRLSQPERPAVAANAKAPALSALMARALAARPGARVDYLFFGDDTPIVTVVMTRKSGALPEEADYQSFDLRDGWQLQWRQPNEGVMYVLRRLHVDMFAGLQGRLFLGTMSLLLLVSILSGVVLYAPFMRRLPFGVLRAPHRAYWLDLHNLLGIVTVVWLGAIAFTGAISALAKPIEMMWQESELREMAATPPDLPGAQEFVGPDEIVALLREAAPRLKVRVLAFPGTPFASPYHMGVYLAGDSPLSGHLLMPALVDAGSGRLVDMREMPLYAKALFISQPLHFGNYGGMPLKILWAILDIISIFLLGSGLYLCLCKPVRAHRKLPLFKAVP